MKKRHLYLLLFLSCCSYFQAMAQLDLTKPESTEVWEPEPAIVTPSVKSGDAPSDAFVLFDGTNEKEWAGKDGPAKWMLQDGAMTVVKGAGDIHTQKEFGDCQLHIEWRSPIESDTLKGQAKGNSGIFLQDRYEVQVLNSYQNRTYSNGQAGAIYKQHIPLANALRKPGEWNAYDIVYTAPRFRPNGTVEQPAYVTVMMNGIIVQNHVEIQGTTEYIGTPVYKKHGKGPIRLQDHGNAVSYRNIWVREL